MFIEMIKRSYRMTKRADARGETRARIVAATIALHEEVGPKETTISAIAERAGVQRLTVYRHFPDDAALLQACSSGWRELNPPPEPASIAGEGRQGCREGLAALYGYYSRTRRMWTSILRDEPDVAALKPPLDRYRRYLAEFGHALLAQLRPRPGRKACAAATLAHAVRFSTWQSLDETGLDDDAKAALVMDWLK